jgi:hypothetical protein
MQFKPGLTTTEEKRLVAEKTNKHTRSNKHAFIVVLSSPKTYSFQLRLEYGWAHRNSRNSRMT